MMVVMIISTIVRDTYQNCVHIFLNMYRMIKSRHIPASTKLIIKSIVHCGISNLIQNENLRVDTAGFFYQNITYIKLSNSLGHNRDAIPLSRAKSINFHSQKFAQKNSRYFSRTLCFIK